MGGMFSPDLLQFKLRLKPEYKLKIKLEMVTDIFLGAYSYLDSQVELLGSRFGQRADGIKCFRQYQS